MSIKSSQNQVACSLVDVILILLILQPYRGFKLWHEEKIYTDTSLV